MNYTGKLFCLFLLVYVVWCKFENKGLKYPVVRRDETVIDDYHGMKVPDPYRWLEDPDLNETKEFVQAQNSITSDFIENSPYRSEIREQLTNMWNYPKSGVPMKRGNKYFSYHNSGLQNQSVLMVQSSLEEEAQVFFDPNKLSADGTVSIKNNAFSKDGSLWAYSLSRSGSDWVTIHVKNVSTGQDLSDVLRYSRSPSISWSHDNLGFFYLANGNRMNSRNKTGTETDESGQEKIYYHKVGNKQEDDPLVLSFDDEPHLSLSAKVSHDGKYLVIWAYEAINEEFIHVASLNKPIRTNFREKLKLMEINDEPASFGYVTNDGHLFYFTTDLDAPNAKLIRVNLKKPYSNWVTVVPETNEVLSWASPINKDMMFMSYMKHVKSTLELRYLQNGTVIQQFPLEIGSISCSRGKRDDTEFFFKLSTFTSPAVTYRIDVSSKNYSPMKFSEPIFPFNTSLMKVEQVFYKSKDGTEVPMYILSRKDYSRDGSAPAYMYSYGGFGTSQKPGFSVSYLLFINHFHGVVAIPSIRGGGEYGQEWSDGGRLLKKQNSFDDFAAAAEYLIANNYTNPSKLTINGASNGGLLVAATANQRPDLFGAAIPEVGVLDMLRFQKFTVGSKWCGEYGCSKNKTYFDNLIKYSPLHNIRMPLNESVQYPAILVKTADHDDRVVPLHSYKYISELQHAVVNNKRQTNPLLIRIEEKAGHGSGTPTSKKIAKLVDSYSFLARALNLTFYNE